MQSDADIIDTYIINIHLIFFIPRPKTLIQLEKFIGTDWEECIWYYISNFALYEPIPTKMSNVCIEQFEKIATSGVYPCFTEYLMKVIVHVYKNLSNENSNTVKREYIFFCFIECESAKYYDLSVIFTDSQ